MIRPIRDRLLLRPVEMPAETALWLPETSQWQFGEVLAVGSGGWNKRGARVQLGVEVGDRLLIKPFSGSAVTVDGEEFLIVREDEVMGVLGETGG